MIDDPKRRAKPGGVSRACFFCITVRANWRSDTLILWLTDIGPRTNAGRTNVRFGPLADIATDQVRLPGARSLQLQTCTSLNTRRP